MASKSGTASQTVSQSRPLTSPAIVPYFPFTAVWVDLGDLLLSSNDPLYFKTIMTKTVYPLIAFQLPYTGFWGFGVLGFWV